MKKLRECLERSPKPVTHNIALGRLFLKNPSFAVWWYRQDSLARSPSELRTLRYLSLKETLSRNLPFLQHTQKPMRNHWILIRTDWVERDEKLRSWKRDGTKSVYHLHAVHTVNKQSSALPWVRPLNYWVSHHPTSCTSRTRWWFRKVISNLFMISAIWTIENHNRERYMSGNRWTTSCSWVRGNKRKAWGSEELRYDTT